MSSTTVPVAVISTPAMEMVANFTKLFTSFRVDLVDASGAVVMQIPNPSLSVTSNTITIRFTVTPSSDICLQRIRIVATARDASSGTSFDVTLVELLLCASSPTVTPANQLYLEKGITYTFTITISYTYPTSTSCPAPTGTCTGGVPPTSS